MTLKFQSCLHITDQGLKNLAGGFETLISLKFIEISYRLCLYITDKGLKALGERLGRLSSLEYISLNFGGCFQVTNQGQKDLVRGLKLDLESLKNLEILPRT